MSRFRFVRFLLIWHTFGNIERTSNTYVMPDVDGSSLDLSEDHKRSWIHVFTRCLQNMLGVIIFIRIQWITEEVGLGMTIGFILLAALVSISTTITIAAFCTDQRDGFFATISTYCSPAVTAGLTVVYVASNVIAYGTFAVAFAETIVYFLRNSGFYMIDGSTNDMRIFSSIFCIAVLMVAIIHSMDNFRLRVIVLLMVGVAVLMQIIGLMIPSLIRERRFNATSTVSDYNPYGAKAMGFIVYFPAVTCIFGGLNLGGNFLNKKRDLFHGTCLALLVASLLYILTAALEAHFVATSPLVLTTATTQVKEKSVTVLKSLPVTLIALISMFYCGYTAMITAGRTAQDMGKCEGLAPECEKLTRPYGNDGSPRKAYVVFSIIALLISMLANFNRVASIMTIYYLSTYCLLNYVAFMATLTAEKPTFRYFNRWIALLTSLLCIHLVLAVSWELTNAAILTFLKFYIFTKWKQSREKGEEKIAGSSYVTALDSLRHMTKETDPIYKPQILVLTGNPAKRPALVDFANAIVMGRSLLTCGYVIPFKPSGRIYLMTEKVDRQMNEWLRNHHIIAYPAVVAAEDQAEGAAALLQATGVGKLRPNILMLGFKTNWEQSSTSDMRAINTFYEIILNAFEKNVGVAIFRNSNVGFDLTKRLTGKEAETENEADDNGIDLDPYQQNATQTSQNSSQKESKVGNLLREVSSFVRMSHTHKTEAPNDANTENNQSTNRFQLVSKHSIKDVREVELLQQLQRFRTKVSKGSIDIWWLKDDGGLTLLLPYLLQLPGAYLEGAHLRVFVPAGTRDSVNDNQRQMATLMQKFRIAASDVHVINTFVRPPGKEIVEEFNRYVNIFKEDYNGEKGLITEEELQNFRSKTNRYLRKAELLRENSQGADLVIVTLPIPRRTDMSSALYMSWLEVISRNMPPTLFVRGNRTSVLSYFD